MLVLITGTTSGIGKSLVKKFLLKKFNVIGIDKKKHNIFKSRNFKSIRLDIRNKRSVYQFLNKMKINNSIPDYFILNAGVNLYDNLKNFNLTFFQKCFDINFYGVMNFVYAIENLKIKKKKNFIYFFNFKYNTKS